ncbi:MAG: FAD-dependent monooxygenase [Actinomycetota bacterium]|nr:FAD-dependent monooxygenase [Actinomycetota bacterium]
MRSHDVVVVGYGPVGAVLAARLGALGVSTLVVEADVDLFRLPRAVAADDEVAHLLDQTAPGLLDGAVTAPDVRFVSRDHQPLGRIAFPDGPHGTPGLSLFHQPTLEARLRAHVATLAAVEVRLGTALESFLADSQGVTARLSDGTTARGSWLVGCDGAASLVRRQAGIPWVGRDLPQQWLVADVEGDVTDRRGFTYTCDPARPQVDMPVPAGHRWEWLLRDAQDRDVSALIRRDTDAQDLSVVRAVTYQFGARRAAHWRRGPVLLAGDAAHTMPPFAGQGLGAGVRDAWSLSWRLASGDPDGYEEERLPHVRAMTRLSLFLGAVLQTGSAPLATARDAGLRAAFTAPALGRWLGRGGPRQTRSGVWESWLSHASS